MILLLDMGNTRFKWAFLENGVLKQIGSAPYNDWNIKGMVDSLWPGFPAPDRVLAVNVAGQGLSDELACYVSERWDIKAEFIKSKKKELGVTNAYTDPDKLGADRWVAMVAAFNKTKGPVCVIDCGSAVTIDVVTYDGMHLGGLIIPGLDMMRKSLTDNTKGVKLDTESRQGNNIFLPMNTGLARNTHEAVTGGTLYALVAMIDRVVKDVADSLNIKLSCLITGGDAGFISPLLSIKHQCEPNLVFEGLALMVESA